MTTGFGETVGQSDASSSVADRRVSPELAGHVRTTFVPERLTVSVGAGKEMLKIVPQLELPPAEAVP